MRQCQIPNLPLFPTIIERIIPIEIGVSDCQLLIA